MRWALGFGHIGLVTFIAGRGRRGGDMAGGARYPRMAAGQGELRVVEGRRLPAVGAVARLTVRGETGDRVIRQFGS